MTCIGCLRVLFCIQFRASVVFVLHHLEKQRSSGVLQGCSTQRTLSSVRTSTLQLASMSILCDPVESRFGPRRWGPDLSVILSTSSLKMTGRPLHPPLLMVCSRVFTLSSNDCLFAVYPAHIRDRRCASRAFPFFSASLSRSSRIPFLSF